jgi:hypothetical protein
MPLPQIIYFVEYLLNCFNEKQALIRLYLHFIENETLTFKAISHLENNLTE